MAIVQDTYNATPAVGYPGMVANGETSNRISRNVADAAGIGFGKAMFQAASQEMDATATPGTDFLGVTIADHGLALLPGGTPDVVPQGRTVGLMDEGVIWVTAAAAVANRAAVFVTPAGAFTSASAGNTAIPAKFMGAAASGAPVRIRIVR